MRRAAAVCLLTMSLLALVTPAPANSAHIAPGDYLETSTGYCTLAYVFDGTGDLEGNVYFLTAAHCVNRVGQTAHADGSRNFGTVAFMGNENWEEHDYAFIKVKDAFHHKVRADVVGHPGVPTGYTTSSETARFDQVGFSGYGLVYEFTPVTRQDRPGLLMTDNSERWQIAGPYLNGDSGGPFFHVETGKALGIESRVCIGLCTDSGPTIEGILNKAAARGFTVELRTA